MDVSITIANWNRADLLEQCLRSVFATPRMIDYEVIVVDNASSDNSVAMVQERFPCARLIVNSVNRGFGGAQNQAMAVARGRYILLLNNDAAVWPDTIPTLVRFMNDRPRAGICSCPAYGQISSSEPTGGACVDFPSLTRTLLWNLWVVCRPPLGWDNSWLMSPVRRWLTGEPVRQIEVEVAWMTGALLMLRQEMIEEIGGFDEQFFLFYEEVDLCRRAWLAGWRILFTTLTSYLHHDGASSELRDDIEELRCQGAFKYFRKHHGLLAAHAVRAQHYVLRMYLLRWRYGLGQVMRALVSGNHRTRGKPTLGPTRETKTEVRVCRPW